MLPLALCLTIAVTVIIERYLFFRRISGAEQAEEILELADNRRLDEALKLTQNTSLPLLKVLSAGLANGFNAAKAMTAAGIAERAIMRRGLPALDTIVTLSPLLGLLGTITGMINSFQIMALSGMGQPHAVTGGIAEALIATATGISVAVIALVPYNYFLARIERETEVMEHYATRLEMVLQTPDKE